MINFIENLVDISLENKTAIASIIPNIIDT